MSWFFLAYSTNSLRLLTGRSLRVISTKNEDILIEVSGALATVAQQVFSADLGTHRVYRSRSRQRDTHARLEVEAGRSSGWLRYGCDLLPGRLGLA